MRVSRHLPLLVGIAAPAILFSTALFSAAVLAAPRAVGTVSAGTTSARAVSPAPAVANSILLPPANLEIYSGRNEPNDGWLIRQHGIRNGPLYPLVWGTRRDQRTESARIISIKRYYLRSSEQPGYRIDRMKLVFSFWKVSKNEMSSRAHEKEPMLEFEFGGKVVLGTGGELAPIDKGFDLRLSAFPPVPSGILFRSHTLATMLSPLDVPIKTNKKYEIEGIFTSDTASFTVNGQPLARAKSPDMNAGLVSIITGWSPSAVMELEVEGHIEGASAATPLRESGLIVLGGKKTGGKKNATGPIAPALTDNKELDKTLLRPVEEEAQP